MEHFREILEALMARADFDEDKSQHIVGASIVLCFNFYGRDARARYRLRMDHLRTSGCFYCGVQMSPEPSISTTNFHRYVGFNSHGTVSAIIYDSMVEFLERERLQEALPSFRLSPRSDLKWKTF